MDIIRFQSIYKPEGKEYVKVTLWNRFMHTKSLLLFTFLPTALALYFLLKDIHSPLWWVFVIIMFYPVYTIAAFLIKVKHHLKLRSVLDSAPTEFTFMTNGILVDRKGAESNKLIYWKDLDFLYELKDFFLLYKNDILILVLSKKDMKDGQCDEIKKYILKFLPLSKGRNYKKTWIF